jgi:predicted PurR-regulated permease PerM
MLNTSELLINKYIYAFFILLLGVFLFYGVREFFTAFLGAVVLYVLFKNIVHYLEKKRKWNKNVAVLLVITLSFLVVVLPISVLIGLIYNKLAILINNPQIISKTISSITDKINNLPIKISTKNITERSISFLTDYFGEALMLTVDTLGGILMMYFFLYFLLIYTRKLEVGLIHFLPFKRTKIVLFGQELVSQTYGNAIGVPAIAVGQGFCAYLCFAIIDIPDAGLWAILTGFASIIPLIGTALVWLPIAGYALMNGNVWQAGVVVIFGVVVLSNIDNLIRMLISKKIGDVHPVITVLGVIIGLKFFSLPGLVFGPLLISYFILLLKLFYAEYNPISLKVQETTTITFLHSNLLEKLVKKIIPTKNKK